MPGTENSQDVPELGPIPHYPNWQYWCSVCERPYEIDVKFSPHYVTTCPECVRKQLDAHLTVKA